MKNSEIFLKSISEGLKALAKGIEEVAEGLDNFQQQDAGEKGVPEAPPAKKSSTRKKTAATSTKSRTTRKKTTAKKSGGRKKSSRKTPPKMPSTDAVMKELRKSPEGLDPSTLAQNTGFTVRTVHNAVSKLKEEGKIESVKRGVYKAA